MSNKIYKALTCCCFLFSPLLMADSGQLDEKYLMNEASNILKDPIGAGEGSGSVDEYIKYMEKMDVLDKRIDVLKKQKEMLKIKKDIYEISQPKKVIVNPQKMPVKFNKRKNNKTDIETIRAELKKELAMKKESDEVDPIIFVKIAEILMRDGVMRAKVIKLNESDTVRVGDPIYSWRVKAINPSSILLIKGAKEHRIGMMTGN